MRYSRLFGKTQFGVAGDVVMPGHQFLLRAGFIAESVAGRYFFLPLGWRVHEKIKAIIKEEMDALGSQEMISPVLHPLELWQETNRTNTTGFELMQVVDRRGASFALGGTAEEMFVDVVRNMQISYKDLPFTLYQFSTKFRDELRARGGLLRVREFVMKDAYSFDRNEEEFMKTYQEHAKAYTRIFQRLGLETVMVEADNGYIGGEYCHEFQVEHDRGEGRFFVTEDGSYAAHEDVAGVALEKVNPDEEILEMKIIGQPAWVRTMEDNVNHYGKDARFFLKNVVYRTNQGDVVIVTIRGDLDVNQVKLEKLLGMVGQLSEASEADLALIGTKPGYVHAWGHKFVKPTKTEDGKRNRKVIYVADNSLKTVVNFIGGQKEDATDSINVNYGRDFKHELEGDVAMAQAGMKNAEGKTLIEKRGIEVGNIFQLGYHYTKLMKGADYVDADGKKKPYYMGCYGIGLGRTMGAIAEIYHDEAGLIWPDAVAPFTAQLLNLGEGGDVRRRAEEVYGALKRNSVEVLWDDREESPGKKFADADLIGCPVRLVVSGRTGDKIEWKRRDSKEVSLLTMDEVLARLRSKNR